MFSCPGPCGSLQAHAAPECLICGRRELRGAESVKGTVEIEDMVYKKANYFMISS